MRISMQKDAFKEGHHFECMRLERKTTESREDISFAKSISKLP